MYYRHILAVFILAVSVTANASDVRISVTEVKDSRSTGEFFNDLEIKLKLTGDDAADVRGIKTLVDKAVDDTGRDLLKNTEKTAEFEAVQGTGAGHAAVFLKFKNPARRATVIKELSGELQLFVPGQDPEAAVYIKNFTKTAGKPIVASALAKAGVQLTVLTKKEYESIKKQEEQKTKEAVGKQGLDQAMLKAFEGLIGAFFQVGEYDLIFKISDPAGKLIDVEVLDGKGTRIETRGHMKSNDLKILNYSEALPNDSQLRIFLQTPKAVISVPLRLSDIALP